MLARQSFLFLIAQSIISLLAFVALIIVARYMGPEALGVFGYCSGIVGLFTIVSSLGFTSTHRKKISEGMDLGLCVGTYTFIKLVLVLTWLILIGMWLSYLSFTDSTLLNSEEKHVLILVALFTAIHQISDIFRSTFIAQFEIVNYSLTEVLSKFITVLLKISFAIMGFGVLYLAYSQLIGYTLLFIFWAYLFRKYPFKYPTKDSIFVYFKFTLPLFLTITMVNLTVGLDLTLIGYFWDTTEVAYFTVPKSITFILGMIASALSTLLLPNLSKKHSEGKIKDVNTIVINSERYLSLFLTPLLVVIIVFTEEITFYLLGEEYSPIIPLFRLLAVIEYLSALNTPYSTKLVSTGFVNYVFIVSIFFYLPHVILNFIFIPETLLGFNMLGFGALGACMARFFGVIMGIVSTRYYNYRTSELSFNINIFIYLFAGSIMSLILVGAKDFTQDILFLSFFIFLSSIAYLFTLYFFSEFTREEYSLIMDVINIKKMLKYIKSELN